MRREAKTMPNDQIQANSTDLDPNVAYGLLGEVLELEKSADELRAKAKEIEAVAEKKRTAIRLIMQGKNIASIKHTSGYQVVLAKEKKFKFPDETTILNGLKKLNWLKLYTTVVPKQVIPEKIEIDQKKLVADLKKNPAAIEYFDGVQVEEAETLKILKPKSNE